MSTYNNLFIGIPIPENYIGEYNKILALLQNVDGNLKLNTTNFLHITILFMGRQDDYNVDEVEKVVKKHKKLLETSDVKIEGFGYFKNKNFDVAHLRVNENEKLKEFFNSIKKDLNHMFLSKKSNFDPHLTLARVKSKSMNKKNLRELESLLKTIWASGQIDNI